MTRRMGTIASWRSRDPEDGFTLIELMVVVLIIAILLAVAIPTFLSARTRSQDRATQSNLRHAFTGAKALYTDKQDYTQVTIAELQADEPSMTFHDASSPSVGPKDIAVNEVDATTVVLAAKSGSGNCWLLKEVLTGSGGTFFGTHGSNTPCDAAPAAATSGSW